MARYRYALILLLSLVVWAAAQAQTSLTPEAGLLVLRNGGVIEGQITRAGDYYVVTQGADVELKLRATEVEAFCGSLEEAYEFKLRHLPNSGVKPHLDLADWCLRHRLYVRCAEQIASGMKLDPANARLKQLQNRLELSLQAPAPAAEAEHSDSGAVSLEQIDKTLRELPKGSVEKFAGSIQPILLNRCGANQCHGPNAKSEFRLLRPPAGQIASRRFTQRNLYATLARLDRSNPEASPLVTLPQSRHGAAPTAVFDKHTQSQLSELIAWVKLTTGAAVAATPAKPPPTIAPPDGTLSQPAAVATPMANAETAPIPATESAVSRPAAASQTFVPRDAFDPEIFNRHYHGKK